MITVSEKEINHSPRKHHGDSSNEVAKLKKALEEKDRKLKDLDSKAESNL